jgi:hypothetical protein
MSESYYTVWHHYYHFKAYSGVIEDSNLQALDIVWLGEWFLIFKGWWYIFEHKQYTKRVT